MLSASDLVLSRSNGNILAGGYKINSLLLEGGHATTLNKKINHNQHLAVPFGLSLLKQYTTDKINNASTVNAGVKISDGELNFSQINRRPPLTFKYISNCLERCIGNPESVDQIMNYIKESRPVEQVTYIRRNYA